MKDNTKNNIKNISNTIFKAVGLAMGVAVVVCQLMNAIAIENAVTLLGIGVACLGIIVISQEQNA